MTLRRVLAETRPKGANELTWKHVEEAAVALDAVFGERITHAAVAPRDYARAATEWHLVFEMNRRYYWLSEGGYTAAADTWYKLALYELVETQGVDHLAPSGAPLVRADSIEPIVAFLQAEEAREPGWTPAWEKRPLFFPISGGCTLL